MFVLKSRAIIILIPVFHFKGKTVSLKNHYMNLSVLFSGFGNSCFEKIKAALAAAFMSIKIC
jgi:hypothetical protein